MLKFYRFRLNNMLSLNKLMLKVYMYLKKFYFKKLKFVFYNETVKPRLIIKMI